MTSLAPPSGSSSASVLDYFVKALDQGIITSVIKELLVCLLDF